MPPRSEVKKSLAAEAKVPLEDCLTPIQRAFVNHPLALTDPPAAARAVGYSESYATQNSYTLRKELMYFIENKSARRMERIELEAGQVLHELAHLAMGNILNYFEVVDIKDKEDKVYAIEYIPKMNLKAMPEEIQRGIKKLEFDTLVLGDGTVRTYISKIEVYDRQKALDTIVDILQLKNTGSKEKPINPLLQNMPADKLAKLREILEEAESDARDREALDGGTSKS